MQNIKPHVALYVHTLGLEENEQATIQRTYNYCTENTYDFQFIYKDAGVRNPVFQEMKEAMHKKKFQILCIPSLLQAHCSHIGQTLQFLKEAQDCQIEVICLYPTPVNIFQQKLALLPFPTQQHIFDLGDIVRYIRLLSA